jgi:hypothetical protein
LSAYHTITTLKLVSVMPSTDIDAREAAQPGWIGAKIEEVSGWIDGQLNKRYAVPFTAPYPAAVTRWTNHLVTFELYRRRGWDPQDQEAVMSQQDAENARTEIQKAADSVEGLYDLPLANGASRISKGGPRVYSEASPYVFTDAQGETGRGEDSNRGGTYG